MANRSWLSASLSENTATFGSMSQCLTFKSGALSDPSEPAGQPSRDLRSEREVYDYLDAIQKTRPGVCVLAFTNPTVNSNGKLPLPTSKDLFNHIARAFSLSETFLTIFNTGLAIYTNSFQPSNTTQHPGGYVAHVVVQQNRAYSAFSVAMTYNLETTEMRVLIFGAKPSTVVELFASLESIRSQTYRLMDIPAIAMELQAHDLSTVIQSCQSQVRSIEISTGMRQFNHPHEKAYSNQQGWKTIDLISITRDLSGLLSRFAFLKMQAETGGYLIDQMTRDAKLLSHSSHEMNGNQGFDVLSKLGQVQSWFHGLAARCRYLSERTNAQSQTVYCLIASQDNAINIEISRASHALAEASQKENGAMRAIAELGRRDNELMIQLSKDSRAIATATAQDSAAMQVIAAITILFLPATFTAAFFSMTFFNFLDEDKPRVSRWTWIYLLVTVVLTLVIQLTWWTISQRKTAKIAQRTAPS